MDQNRKYKYAASPAFVKKIFSLIYRQIQHEIGYFYNLTDATRHNCAYICGGICLTRHKGPPSNHAGADELRGVPEPPDPRHGRAPALGRGRPPGLGQQGLSIAEEPSKPSCRPLAEGVACRNGCSARRRRPTIARSVDERGVSRVQGVSKYQDSLQSGLRYKRLEAGTFQFPFAQTGRKELAAWELAVLLEGIDLDRGKRRKRYSLPESTASAEDNEGQKGKEP